MEENKLKSTHRDTVSAAHALRMRGLNDKRQLLAKLRIAGSENSAGDVTFLTLSTFGSFFRPCDAVVFTNIISWVSVKGLMSEAVLSTAASEDRETL